MVFSKLSHMIWEWARNIKKDEKHVVSEFNRSSTEVETSLKKKPQKQNNIGFQLCNKTKNTCFHCTAFSFNIVL